METTQRFTRDYINSIIIDGRYRQYSNFPLSIFFNREGEISIRSFLIKKPQEIHIAAHTFFCWYNIKAFRLAAGDLVDEAM